MKARIKAPPRIPPENQQQFIIPFLSPLCMMWLGVCCQLSPGDRDNCLMFGVCRAHRVELQTKVREDFIYKGFHI